MLESSFEHASDVLILHCHVPKTAGTTVSTGLRNSFEIFHFHHFHPDPFYIISRKDLERLLEIDPALKSISSHHLRSFPLSISGRPTFLFTFLRKPEDQFISQLKHIRHNFFAFPPEVRSHWPEETPRLSLRELAKRFLDLTTSHQDFSPQTRFFCNSVAMGRFGLSDGNSYGLDSREIAESILENFQFVGIVDEMKKSLELLTDLLAYWGVKVYFETCGQQNRSPQRTKPVWMTPEDEVGHRVLEASKSDLFLYRHFRDKLVASHKQLRKLRWLGFGPAAVDAKDAFNNDGLAEAARSILNSARLYRNPHGLRDRRFPIQNHQFSSDLLEHRVAKAFIEKRG